MRRPRTDMFCASVDTIGAACYNCIEVNMSFFENVYEAVQLIPRGKVATYGQIARMIGAPRSSRAVGYALHANPRPGVIPCHRVVNREGRLAPAFAFGGPEIQAQLLESEGVEVDENFTVDLDVYLWKTDAGQY